MPQYNASNAGHLPTQFVSAMKTLFDIMDDDRTGFVKLSDIENRWRDNGAKGLPKGVIDCLRNISPHDGLLSFDQFCSGLKVCLLKNQEEHSHFQSQKPVRITSSNPNIQFSQPQCPPSIVSHNALPHISSNWSQKKMILPTNEANIINAPITNYSQMMKDRGNGFQLDNPEYFFSSEKFSKNPHLLYPPPKPPRTATGLDKNIMNSEHLESQERLKIRIVPTIANINNSSAKNLFTNEELVFVPNNRGAGDGKPATALELNCVSSDLPLNSDASNNLYLKKANVRRREPRRHTLQNGIDYNMLKRMKKIEQEKDVLIQGLAAVDKARDWYLKQLEKVQEKIRFLGRMGSHMEQWTEAQEERLELQRARIFELNRQLEALTECWQKGGLSIHMNLALSPQHSNSSSASNAIARLQQQNHLLTEDIMKKRDRISMLEGEKSSLIRELLQLRSHGSKSEIF